MDAQSKWNSIELLSSTSSSYASQTLLEMKKMYDMLKSYHGVWATTQDSVETMNNIKDYRQYMEDTRGRLVRLVIDGASIPDGMEPEDKKA